MARKSKELKLFEEEHQRLEQGYKTNENHCFRQRCKMVLLKAEGYTSEQIATISNTNEISVHKWLKRYAAAGIACLQTRKGQGRKPILQHEHLSIVRAAVKQERQRLSQAQHIVEQILEKR